MQFAQPQNLWSLLVLVPMLLAYLWWWRWKLRLMDRLGDRGLLQEMAHTQSARRQIARAVFLLLGTALICIAYAQPQWGQTNRPIKRTGVDVVFALDLSTSMSARDVAPNRLDAAKNEIKTTLDVLRGDRVGLVVFTAISFVQTPLTTDYGAIRFYLDRLEPGQMPLGGTSLGRAVTDGVELLTGKRLQEGAPTEIEMRRAKNQIVVLITDGEDHESDPRAASQLAANNDIKIVTVGFGSEDGEHIPVVRPDGSLAGFKRDRKGELVKTRLDSKTLEQMADATGGTYVHYSGEHSVANALVNYINALEKTEIETMLKERYRERFQFFALPGLILLLLSLLLGERKPRRRKRASALALISVVALSSLGCDRAFEDTLSAVDRGNELIEEGEFEQALEAYREAETKIPARPELHFDIGRALLGLEKWDEAAGAFARALETQDVSLRFDALNNLGLAHAGRESWRDAWQTFQDALVLAAQSPLAIDAERVADTRHNLEVAWRKLYPPCAMLEDEHEENDTPEQATQLEQPSVKDATLCGLDDDWYVIGAIPGSTVSVTAKFRDLRDQPDEEIPFLAQAADLQIALFDETGKTALAVDQGEDPVGDTRNATRTIARFQVDESMTSDETGRLLLRVGASDTREFEYDLEIQSIPPCHALEEEYEDNDTPEQAKTLNPGSYEMHYCGGDHDWFAISVEAGDAIFVDIQTPPDAERERPASLGVEIFDPRDRLAAEGEVEGVYLTAGVRAIEEAGRYLIHVFGRPDDEQGPYKLDIYRFAPCPVGDDRFEQNDTAASAAPLDPSEPTQRYLRACDQDPDFFRVDFEGDEKKVNVGLARVSTPPPNVEPTDLPPFQFDLVSASGSQILVAGAEVIMPPTPPPSAAEDVPPQLPLELVVQADELEGDAAILRVLGEDEFYHLVQVDPQQQSSSDENQDKNDQQDGEQDPGDSEQQEEDDQGNEDQDSDGEDQGGDEEQPQPNPEPEDPEESDQQQPAPGEEAESGRLEDILEALEATDDNFQMKKALENMPTPYLEKDW